MTFDLVPSFFWNFPAFRFPSLWEEEEKELAAGPPSGLTVSEDEKNVYIEAAVPGIDPKEIEVTFDRGILWIKGEAKEEEKKKKYYRKASRSFSYRVAVPGEIDSKVEPVATCKNGVMAITFAKSAKVQPKKISVKAEK
jgi:HSP20 family protein